MIVIKSASGAGIVGSVGGRAFRQEVEIIADTEAEITALGNVVDDGSVKVIPTAGSMAYTPDMTVMYMLSASGVWTKTV